MKNIENGHFHHTLLSALSCDFWWLWPGVLVSICSLDSLVSWCAEQITQPCGVKVTVEGQEFEPWISCMICISFTWGKLFIKLWFKVRLSEMMCRTCHSTMPTKNHSHSRRLPVLAFNFVFSPDLLYCWKDFHLTYAKCWPQWDDMHNIINLLVQAQGHNWRSWLWAFYFMTAQYLLHAWKDFHER